MPKVFAHQNRIIMIVLNVSVMLTNVVRIPIDYTYDKIFLSYWRSIHTRLALNRGKMSGNCRNVISVDCVRPCFQLTVPFETIHLVIELNVNAGYQTPIGP